MAEEKEWDMRLEASPGAGFMRDSSRLYAEWIRVGNEVRTIGEVGFRRLEVEACVAMKPDPRSTAVRLSTAADVCAEVGLREAACFEAGQPEC